MKKYQKRKLVKRSKKKKLLLFVLAGILVILGTLLVLEKTHKINLISTKAASPKSTVTPAEGKDINLDPPTDEEKQAGNEQKDEIAQEKQQQQTAPPPSSSNKKSVKPVIVTISADNGQIDVRGFVSGVFEEGGTCTARFTKPGSAAVTKTTTGFEDYNKTTCSPFTFPATHLPAKGDWSVTLSYASAIAEGTSDAVTFKVQ